MMSWVCTWHHGLPAHFESINNAERYVQVEGNKCSPVDVKRPLNILSLHPPKQQKITQKTI